MKPTRSPAAKILRRIVFAFSPRRRIRSAFTDHYRLQGWSGGETVSGPGSTLERTARLRAQLPALFTELGIRRVLDVGCGDFNWFRAVEAPLDLYVGTDVVEELVAANQRRFGNERRTFLTRDATRDALPAVDLILCRDCLVHLKDRHILAALANFTASGSRYLLATMFAGRSANVDAPLGGWRPVNLQLPPFGLPPPQRLLVEGAVEDERYADKALGLWPLAHLRTESKRTA
jgi:SAM-dependent methyltransferase